MSMELLFNDRKKIGENILNIIRDNGYTKSSFSKLTNISRPTLDKLIDGTIDNLTTFTTHIEKILESLNLTEEQLSIYTLKDEKKEDYVSVFSNNSPKDHLLSPQAKEMFLILEDIVHLYELYHHESGV